LLLYRVPCWPHTWPGGGCDGLVADKEVEILSATLCRQMARRAGTAGQEGGLLSNRGTARASGTAAGRTLGRNGGREDERRRIVTGETWRESDGVGHG